MSRTKHQLFLISDAISIEDTESYAIRMHSKFFSPTKTNFENFTSLKKADLNVFNCNKFLSNKDYILIFHRYFQAKKAELATKFKGYRTTSVRIKEYVDTMPEGEKGLGMDVDIFPESLEWAIICNHNDDILLTCDYSDFINF